MEQGIEWSNNASLIVNTNKMREAIFSLSQEKNNPPEINYDCTKHVAHKYYVATVESRILAKSTAGVQQCIHFLKRMRSLNNVCGNFIIQSFRV